MSLFIKAQRFASAPRLLRIRDLYVSIGEDQQGLLTSNPQGRCYFSLYVIDNRCLLQADCSSIRIGEQLLEKEQQIFLSDSAQIQVDDYQFTIISTPALAEVLAHSAGLVEEIIESSQAVKTPTIEQHIGDCLRRYPILKGLIMTIGSDASATICVDLPRITPHHCKIAWDGSAVAVTPLDGSVLLNEESIGASRQITKSSRLTLEPSGFTVKIVIPDLV